MTERKRYQKHGYDRGAYWVLDTVTGMWYAFSRQGLEESDYKNARSLRDKWIRAQEKADRACCI